MNKSKKGISLQNVILSLVIISVGIFMIISFRDKFFNVTEEYSSCESMEMMDLSGTEYTCLLKTDCEYNGGSVYKNARCNEEKIELGQVCCRIE